ncbi:uncharacterized protein LOC131159252 [Malania oleifera]|uniref:uncharacterized protein LOC131159252 n=1 Tax=Malania oleifera TaxID=397392 RepID=UPI0025ADDEAB|nr:uncharacterized protein LOC131159252 [Malania oleifera]
MASGNMKGFFRQRKGSGGIAKPNPKTSRATSKTKLSTPSHSATLGSDDAQSPSLTSHSSLHPNKCEEKNYGEKEEEVLRQFDMNMTYGPCLGMSRLARWERAHRLGLNPPPQIQTLLESASVRSECLWDGVV